MGAATIKVLHLCSSRTGAARLCMWTTCGQLFAVCGQHVDNISGVKIANSKKCARCLKTTQGKYLLTPHKIMWYNFGARIVPIIGSNRVFLWVLWFLQIGYY